MRVEAESIFLRIFRIVLVFSALGLAFSASKLGAQDRQTSEPIRHVTYRSIALEQRIPNLWVQDADGVMQRLILSDSRISPPRSSKLNDGLMPIFRKSGGNATTAADRSAGTAMPMAETEWEIVGQVRYPQEGEEFLLVVSDTGNNAIASERYQATVLPHDDVSREGGLSKFYNYSSVQVGCQIDGEVFRLNPGQTRIVRPADKRSQSNLGLRVAAQNGDSWQMVFSSVWDYRPHLNALLFIFDDARQPGGIAIKRVFDQPYRTGSDSAQ